MTLLQTTEGNVAGLTSEETAALQLDRLVELLSEYGDEILISGINSLLIKSVSYETLCTAWGIML